MFFVGRISSPRPCLVVEPAPDAPSFGCRIGIIVQSAKNGPPYRFCLLRLSSQLPRRLNHKGCRPNLSGTKLDADQASPKRDAEPPLFRNICLRFSWLVYKIQPFFRLHTHLCSSGSSSTFAIEPITRRRNWRDPIKNVKFLRTTLLIVCGIASFFPSYRS